jgi:hypothetical protein
MPRAAMTGFWGWRLLGVAALMAAGLSHGRWALAMEPVRVLHTFQVGDALVDLSVAGCHMEPAGQGYSAAVECPVQVRLLSQGRPLHHVVLPVPAYSSRARAERPDLWWGAAASGLRAWGTGVETGYVGIAAGVIHLAPQVSALLVIQNYGFEHVHHQHLLILARAGRLHVIWKGSDAMDHSSTWVEVLGNAAIPVQKVLYFRAADGTDEDIPDRFEAVRLAWDPLAGRIRERPLPERATPLYLVAHGTYASLAQARQAHAKQSGQSNCQQGFYWVLDASLYPEVSGGALVLGMLYGSRAAAQGAIAGSAHCEGGTPAALLRLTRRR